MNKIFKKYVDIFKIKNTILNIIVDESFDFSSTNVKNFENFNSMSNYDFVDLSGNNLIYYRSNSNYNKGYYKDNRPKFDTFTFKKGKFYTYQTIGKFWDELQNEINESNEIWYDPFYFVLNEDLIQAERYLKLNKLSEICQ